MNKSLKFVFNGYESNLEKGEVFFHFGFRGEKNIDFTEKISFPPVKNKIPEELLKSVLNNLMLILGISYWKAYCPKEIVVKNNFLAREQAEFWNTVYTRGMGEFYYKNKIDFRGLASFPYEDKEIKGPTLFPRQNRYLVGIGGGKDSIVAAELLRKQDKQVDLATSSFPIQIEVAKEIGGKIINTKREIDSKLLELNKQQGVYNGHIPISVYYAFLMLLMAELFDYKHVVVGNEKSANYGNVKYLGQVINHQWSKSEEFEKLFQEYLKKFVTPDIEYSSPLRQMTELQVVEEFVKYPQYFKVFSSCNRNYRIKPFGFSSAALTAGAQGLRWCGECAKCLFVFICLAAFLPQKEVLDIFGKNLFEDKSLLPLFEELVGVKNFKPFECVGTPEEVKEAFSKIKEKGEFSSSLLVKHYKSL